MLTPAYAYFCTPVCLSSISLYPKGGLRTPQSMCAVRIDPRTYSDEAFNGVTNMDLAP